MWIQRVEERYCVIDRSVESWRRWVINLSLDDSSCQSFTIIQPNLPSSSAQLKLQQKSAIVYTFRIQRVDMHSICVVQQFYKLKKRRKNSIKLNTCIKCVARSKQRCWRLWWVLAVSGFGRQSCNKGEPSCTAQRERERERDGRSIEKNMKRERKGEDRKRKKQIEKSKKSTYMRKRQRNRKK